MVSFLGVRLDKILLYDTNINLQWYLQRDEKKIFSQNFLSTGTFCLQVQQIPLFYFALHACVGTPKSNFVLGIGTCSVPMMKRRRSYNSFNTTCPQWLHTVLPSLQLQGSCFPCYTLHNSFNLLLFKTYVYLNALLAYRNVKFISVGLHANNRGWDFNIFNGMSLHQLGKYLWENKNFKCSREMKNTSSLQRKEVFALLAMCISASTFNYLFHNFYSLALEWPVWWASS